MKNSTTTIQSRKSVSKAAYPAKRSLIATSSKKHVRLYENYPSNNKFYLGGRLITSSQPWNIVGTLMVLIAPMALFYAKLETYFEGTSLTAFWCGVNWLYTKYTEDLLLLPLLQPSSWGLSSLHSLPPLLALYPCATTFQHQSFHHIRRLFSSFQHEETS